MADIFISYSRKDSHHALSLAEQFRAEGIEVWIDQHGIHGAEHWGGEIVEGIRTCTTFILLLSPHSVESENVLRELSLASEKRKRVLPVVVEPMILPSAFEYPLAGLQRVEISDFDAILRAHKHGVIREKIADPRKSLIVLPFEDLSPDHDNGWFADGLAGEMIDSFSHIKSLRLIDRKTAMDLKGFHGKIQEIAESLQVRYFVQGTVRKFGDQIKISTSLLDIETGEYLWQDSHRGEFKDIFDIQEAVAGKVVEGLKLHLSKEEKEKLRERGTQNAEAYELRMRSVEFAEYGTREGSHHAIKLLDEAIRLDSAYSDAYQAKALILIEIFSYYEHDPALLVEAERLAEQALQLKPDLWIAYNPLTHIYRIQGKLEDAEKIAKLHVEKAPHEFISHHNLGMYYVFTGQPLKAITALENAARIKPHRLGNLQSLTVNCFLAKDEEKLAYWSAFSIPYFQRQLLLYPEDHSSRVNLAIILNFAGRNEDARAVAKSFDTLRDPLSLYNASCLWESLGEPEMAMKTFRKAIEAGYRNLASLREFQQGHEFTALRGTPEYEELMQMVEKIIAQEEAKKSNG